MKAVPSTPVVHPFAGYIGVAREDITPPVGIYSRSWGAAKHDVAESVHRPFTLTCVTFQKSPKDSPLVLLAADLGWWKSLEDEHQFRHGVLEALSLKPSQLMMCLSHTHAGPSLSSENASKPGGELIAPYLSEVRDRAVRVIQRAMKKATAALLSWRYDKCTLATCRDLPDPERDRFVVGFNPEKPADDTLLVGRITDGNQKPLGTIINYACHPTALAWENRLLSPDYVGAMRETIEKQTDAPCLFLQGASGELSPAEQYTGDVSLPESHGRRLGYAALSALEGMLPAESRLVFSGVVESGAPLAIWKRQPQEPSSVLCSEMVEMELPLKQLPSLAELERKWQECTDHVLKERLWRTRAVRKMVGDGSTARFGVWLWRLGDSLLIGQPNETYSGFQMELRSSLSPHPVAVMNVTNGHLGYLPPRELYEHDVYQVWQTPFAAGGLELLTERTLRAARELLK
jgi:hypothetical protein